MNQRKIGDVKITRMIDSQGPPTTTKAELAKALGFDEVIDLTLRSWAMECDASPAVVGAEIVIDSLAADVLGEALAALPPNGVSLGY